MSHSWIYEEDPARLKPACHVCPHPKWKNGQWMMFFPNSLIDEKWDQAVDLYRRGKLTGVQSMKVICLLLVFECPSCLFIFLRKLYNQIFFRFLPFEKIWTWTSKIDHVDLQRFMWSFSIVDHPIIEILWWKLDIICFDILHTKICMVPCFTLIAKVLVTLRLNIESICQIIAIAWCVSKHKSNENTKYMSLKQIYVYVYNKMSML